MGLRIYNKQYLLCRSSHTLPKHSVEKHRRSPLSNTRINEDNEEENIMQEAPRDYKYIFPEFLPSTTWYLRDTIREKLERRDMMRRRNVMEIPEFYVGSIMAVTASDPHAPGKQNRFVGICINRGGVGLRAHFTLRNVVDGQGVEIMYEMYNPTVQMIEVIKLEKRLDDELYYLRDADAKHSTISFDMAPVPHPPGATVPLNTTVVTLKPRPWHERWERKELQGAHIPEGYVTDKMKKQAEKYAEPWEKYDLMKQYRNNINDIETDNIMKEVHKYKVEIDRRHGPKKILPTGALEKFRKQRMS